MSRRGSNRGLPAWYKGRLIYDDIDGTWWGEESGKIFKQRGLNVSKKNYDSLTDLERQQQISRRSR